MRSEDIGNTHSPGDRDRILADNLRLHRSMAPAYDRVHPHMRNSYEQWLQTRDIQTMLRRLGTGNGVVNVLDLGCGTGNLTVRFLEEGARVTAVDMSTEMLSVLSAKLEYSARHRARCDLLELDVDEFLSKEHSRRFDVIAMSSVAHHLPDYLDSVSKLADLISPCGFLYMIHEPAHKAELTTSALAFRRLWSIVPRGTDRLLRKTQVNAALHRQWEAQDTRYADYHYHRDGISVRAISARLSQFRLVQISRYNAHETSFVSWLDNYWGRRLRYEQFQRTYFRAIWRRQLERP